MCPAKSGPEKPEKMADSMPEQEFLRLERENVTRIERLEETVGLVRQDLAKVLTKLDRPPDGTYKWALGLILTGVGSAFLLLWQNDNNLASEITERISASDVAWHRHTEDKHPTIVQAQVGRLEERLECLTRDVQRLTDA